MSPFWLQYHYFSGCFVSLRNQSSLISNACVLLFTDRRRKRVGSTVTCFHHQLWKKKTAPPIQKILKTFSDKFQHLLMWLHHVYKHMCHTDIHVLYIVTIYVFDINPQLRGWFWTGCGWWTNIWVIQHCRIHVSIHREFALTQREETHTVNTITLSVKHSSQVFFQMGLLHWSNFNETTDAVQ